MPEEGIAAAVARPPPFVRGVVNVGVQNRGQSIDSGRYVRSLPQQGRHDPVRRIQIHEASAKTASISGMMRRS